VHLGDGRTAHQVWAEEHRETEHAGDFYRETARVVPRGSPRSGIVAQTLWGQSTPPETEGTTYGALLRSYQFFVTRVPADFVPAIEALRRAVASEPECALAWVQLSRLHVANHAFEIAPAETSIEQGLAFAHNAVRLDPSSQRARAALAFTLLVKGETAMGLHETENALALNPETFVYLETLGWLLALLGEWDRGTRSSKAIARNPTTCPSPTTHSGRTTSGAARSRSVPEPSLPRRRLVLAERDAGLLPGPARRRKEAVQSPSCSGRSPTSRAAGAR
jgi:hypothetical protein